MSRPCNWVLPAAFHAQPKLPYTCLCKLEGTPEIPTGGHCTGTVTFQTCASSSRSLWCHVQCQHVHWPCLAQQWNQPWGDFSECYRPHSCQHIPKLPLPDAFGKCRESAQGLDGGRRKRRKKRQKWEKEVGQNREGRSRAWLRDKGRKHHIALIGREDELVIIFNLPLSFAFPETWYCLHTIPSCSRLIYRHPQHLAQACSLAQAFPFSSSCLQSSLLTIGACGCSLGACSVSSWRSPAAQSLEPGYCHHHALFYTCLLSWFPKCL